MILQRDGIHPALTGTPCARVNARRRSTSVSSTLVETLVDARRRSSTLTLVRLMHPNSCTRSHACLLCTKFYVNLSSCSMVTLHVCDVDACNVCNVNAMPMRCQCVRADAMTVKQCACASCSPPGLHKRVSGLPNGRHGFSNDETRRRRCHTTRRPLMPILTQPICSSTS